ncbi:hypothetical protein HY492_01385 [Candidatus Woesearchaeota archaeon]|nr:hypothetical protein [Candidatus Woesearchaeota archaeon]
MASVEIEEVEYADDAGESLLSLRFTDGSGFQMLGTTHVRRFLDDCLRQPCEEIVNGIANLAGNKFWAYQDGDGIMGISCRRASRQQYELKDVTKEFVR